MVKVGAYSAFPLSPPAAKFASQGDAHLRTDAQINFLYYPLYMHLTALITIFQKMTSQGDAHVRTDAQIKFLYYPLYMHLKVLITIFQKMIWFMAVSEAPFMGY